MVIIRLARHGSKRRPFYQVVVADSKFKPTGRFIERVGYYNVHNKDECKLDRERIEHWIKQGAQLSDAVKRLYKKHKNAA